MSVVLSFRKSKILGFLIAFSLGFLSFVPTALEPASLILILALACHASLVFYRRGTAISVPIHGCIVTLFLLYLVFCNSFISIFSGNYFSSFFRAVVPFLFFVFYLFFYNDDEFDDLTIYDLVWLSSFFWLLKIFIFSFSDILLVLSGELARLSYTVDDVLVPFGVIGVVLTLYKKDLQVLFRWILVFAFSSIVIMAGYRSQALMLIAVVFFYFRVWKSIWGLLLCFCVVAALGYLYAIGFPAIEVLMSRMSGSGGDSIRKAELDFAIGQFLESPILGKGLPVAVPIEITRSQDTAIFFERDSVPYMHNFIGYFLMNTGVIGAAFISLIFVMPLFLGVKKWLKGDREINEGVLIVIALLVVFFLVSASFRQIQMILVFVLLSCFIYKRAQCRN